MQYIAALGRAVTPMAMAEAGRPSAVCSSRSTVTTQDGMLQAPPGRCCRQPAPGPPSLRRPQALTPPTPGGIGLPVRHTYQAVLRYPGISATDLAPHASLVHAPDSARTSSQLRTLDEHLQTLAGLGLVQVEPDGTWSPAVTTELEPGVLRPAQAAQQAVDDAVSAEREAYRHVTFSRSRRGPHTAVSQEPQKAPLANTEEAATAAFNLIPQEAETKID